VDQTPIPGLLVVRLPVHADARGWFKENWQRQKMVDLGLPDFGPVQNNVSFNTSRGATRGIHAEPWDKLVSIATGRVFAAWVDLREGDSFGSHFHLELDPGVAVFVPRGVGNSYQTLTDETAYSYLVNAHWRPGITYPALALGDPSVAIPWPIPLAQAQISEKDLQNPPLARVQPAQRRRTLVIGGKGQLGHALAGVFPGAELVDIDELDLADRSQMRSWQWDDYETVINAAAFTAVDAAETAEGRAAAWAANAVGPANLAEIARDHGLTVVHYSSDYVFDGRREVHDEEEPFTPLGVYGQSKAAGDIAIATSPRHYLLRTSWVVGSGKNFVRTMHQLARDGVSPSVVGDQIGRLTFTDELARATQHLLTTGTRYGTYNVTNSGDPLSWAAIAKLVFELSGRSADDVAQTSTASWAAGRQVSPRPVHSTLDTAKLRATGFEPRDQVEALTEYVAALDD